MDSTDQVKPENPEVLERLSLLCEGLLTSHKPRPQVSRIGSGTKPEHDGLPWDDT